jgi:hypothetical protein
MCQHVGRGFSQNPVPVQVPTDGEDFAWLDVNAILKNDGELNDTTVAHIR